MKNDFESYKLGNEILKALEMLEYNNVTKVQEAVIPEVLLNKDVIVKAQTGTGKTASFVIPLCEKAIWEENDPQVLILAPTRELAIQISEDATNIGRYKRIRSVVLYGKAPFKDQSRELKGKTHIVIGTPGRVLDHIDRGTLITENIKYLVIDEADQMLNMGFIKQVQGLIRRLPSKRVTMLFSATLPDEIVNLCTNFMNRPVNIEIESENLLVERIDHWIYKLQESDKLDYLKKLLIKEKPETAVVFCKLRENVDSVYEFLKESNYSVDKIHGGMLQNERNLAMDRFKKGEFRVLVATDVAARGIDVEGITHVINFDPPLEKEAYVHRLGRTARAGKSGRAITFITNSQERVLKEIEEYIGFEIKELPINNLETNIEEIIASEEFLKKSSKKKEQKGDKVNKGIIKLYFNGGKKKKIRAIDFVGTISNIDGIQGEDIGIIDIQDNGSYVDILNGKGSLVLDALKGMTIKGKKLKVEKARK